MTVKINTKDGQIELTDEVIATVVGGAATEIFGVVGMASKNALKDNFQLPKSHISTDNQCFAGWG